MTREQLKLVDRFLAFGDVRKKEDETDNYQITDKGMIKVILGYEEEVSQLKRCLLDKMSNRVGHIEIHKKDI